MKQKHKSSLNKINWILIVISSILFIWASIILIFNKGDFIPDALFHASYLYPGLIDQEGKPRVDMTDYNGIVIDIDYISRGAFVAGEDNPINIFIKMQPLGKPVFFNEIKDRKRTIKFIFDNTGGYPTKINKYLGGPEPEGIDNFNFDGKYLNGTGRLYYLTGGEFAPTILYGDEAANKMTGFQAKGQEIFIASQDVSLQLINNSRLFALAIITIGLTLIQIAKMI